MAEKQKKSASWWKSLKKEFSKIMWPDVQTIVRQTVAVIATSVVVAVIIVIFDYIIQYGVDILVNL